MMREEQIQSFAAGQAIQHLLGECDNFLVVDPLRDVESSFAVFPGIGHIMQVEVQLGNVPVGEHQLLLIFGYDHLLCFFEDSDYVVPILYGFEWFVITLFAIHYYFLLLQQNIQYICVYFGLVFDCLFFQLLLAKLSHCQTGLLLLPLHAAQSIIFFQPI